MKRIFKFIYWLFVGRFDGVGYTPQDPIEGWRISRGTKFFRHKIK
jgi:hypothetical protein